MAELVESLSECSVSTANVTLRFRFDGERWGHAIEVGPRKNRTVFAESMERTADLDQAARVINPTYQEIHWKQEGLHTLALLIGRAGQHHFSAVFRLVEGEDDPTDLIEIDLADRCRAEIESLAATYKIRATGPDLIGADLSGATWETGSIPTFVNLSSMGTKDTPARIAVAESGRQAMQAQILVRIVPGLATQRLIYAWSISAI